MPQDPLFNTLLQKAQSIGPPKAPPLDKVGMMPMPPALASMKPANLDPTGGASNFGELLGELQTLAKGGLMRIGLDLAQDSGLLPSKESVIDFLVNHGPMPEQEKTIRVKHNLPPK